MGTTSDTRKKLLLVERLARRESTFPVISGISGNGILTERWL